MADTTREVMEALRVINANAARRAYVGLANPTQSSQFPIPVGDTEAPALPTDHNLLTNVAADQHHGQFHSEAHSASGNDALTGVKRVYKYMYRFATLGGFVGSSSLQKAHGDLPEDFVVQHIYLDILTPLAAGVGGTAALTLNTGLGHNLVLTPVVAALVAGAPWSTTGPKGTAVLPATLTTWFKVGAGGCWPRITFAVANTTAGSFNVFVEGYLSN